MESSGERLARLLEAAGVSPYRFAAYYAGYALDEAVPKKAEGEQARRFQSFKRSLHRWLGDEHAIADDSAVEVVTVANRLLIEKGAEPFPLDYLVTPVETRRAGMEELRLMLQEALERLARIEERL